MAARTPRPATTVRSRDGCVVESAPLAAVLVGFVEHWNRDHLIAVGRPFASDTTSSVSQIGAIAWLAEETRVPLKTIQNIARVDPDTGQPRPRTRFTELRIADALVQAIDRPQLFHDGTLTVQPNPLAKRSARVSCC